MVLLLNLGGAPLLPQDASGMGPTWLLREIRIKEFSNLVLTGEDGPAIESACVHSDPKQGGGANGRGGPMPWHDLLFGDGPQGSHEVVERPGFGTQ